MALSQVQNVSKTCAILLAAGESTRMGSHKATLDWQGQSLIGYQLSQLTQTSIGTIFVVLGYQASELQRLIKPYTDRRISLLVNKDFAMGKSTSIKLGVKKSQASEAIMIIGVDQPRPSSVLQLLLDTHASSGAAITVPTCGGRNGHPPVYSGRLRDELLSINEETQGLRAVNEKHRSETSYVPCDTDVVLVNLNTPADYDRFYRKYGATPIQQPGASSVPPPP